MVDSVSISSSPATLTPPIRLPKNSRPAHIIFLTAIPVPTVATSTFIHPPTCVFLLDASPVVSDAEQDCRSCSVGRDRGSGRHHAQSIHRHPHPHSHHRPRPRPTLLHSLPRPHPRLQIDLELCGKPALEPYHSQASLSCPLLLRPSTPPSHAWPLR